MLVPYHNITRRHNPEDQEFSCTKNVMKWAEGFWMVTDKAIKAQNYNFMKFCIPLYYYTRVVWKVLGLVAVRRCYAEGGGDLCEVVVMEVT
jgi:hypothetical protein